MMHWKLDALLADRGLTQQRAADLCGVHRQFISRLVNRPPRRYDASTLETLCRGLDVTVPDLLEYVPDE